MKFTQQVVKTRGNVSAENINDFLTTGFTKQHVFELMIIIAIKTLSNYTNHMTHPEPNQELLDGLLKIPKLTINTLRVEMKFNNFSI